jgi:hypothetical protein
MVAFSRTCRLCAQPRASAIPVLPLLVLPRVKLISRFYLRDESGPCGCRRAAPRAQAV